MDRQNATQERDLSDFRTEWLRHRQIIITIQGSACRLSSATPDGRALRHHAILVSVISPRGWLASGGEDLKNRWNQLKGGELLGRPGAILIHIGVVTVTVCNGLFSSAGLPRLEILLADSVLTLQSTSTWSALRARASLGAAPGTCRIRRSVRLPPPSQSKAQAQATLPHSRHHPISATLPLSIGFGDWGPSSTELTCLFHVG